MSNIKKNLQVMLRFKTAPQNLDQVSKNVSKSISQGLLKTNIFSSFGKNIASNFKLISDRTKPVRDGFNKFGQAVGSLNQGFNFFTQNVEMFVNAVKKQEELVKGNSAKSDEILKAMESLTNSKQEQGQFIRLLSSFAKVGVGRSDMLQALQKFRNAQASGKLTGTKYEGLNTMNAFATFLSDLTQVDTKTRNKMVSETVDMRSIGIFSDLAMNANKAFGQYAGMTQAQADEMIRGLQENASVQDALDAQDLETLFKENQIAMNNGLNKAVVEANRLRKEQEVKSLARKTGEDLIAGAKLEVKILDKKEEIVDTIQESLMGLLEDPNKVKVVANFVGKVLLQVLDLPAIGKALYDIILKPWVNLGIAFKNAILEALSNIPLFKGLKKQIKGATFDNFQ